MSPKETQQENGEWVEKDEKAVTQKGKYIKEMDYGQCYISMSRNCEPKHGKMVF